MKSWKQDEREREESFGCFVAKPDLKELHFQMEERVYLFLLFGAC